MSTPLLYTQRLIEQAKAGDIQAAFIKDHENRLKSIEAGGVSGSSGGGGFVVAGPGVGGIVGGGVANDRAAIQSVISANPGRTVLLRAGTYNVDGGAMTLANGSSLIGEGRQATVLTQTSADTSMLVLGEASNLADIGLRHLPGVAPTSGTMIYITGAGRSLFEHHGGRVMNVWLDSPWEGIRCDSGRVVTGPVNYCLMGIFLNDIIINSLYSRGIVFRDVADAHLSKCWIDGGAGHLGYGLNLDGFNEGIEIAGAEVIYCEYGLVSQGYTEGTVFPELPNLGQRASANAFTNCYFDSHNMDGAYLDVTSKTAFSNCWFAGNGRNGVSNCNQSWGNRFSTCTFYANHQWGVSTSNVTSAYDLHLSIVDSIFPDNYTGGVDIYPGHRRFTIRGNHFGRELGPPFGLGFGAAQYGVRVQTGASDFYTITDNIAGANAHSVAFIDDGGSGLNKNVGNNY